MEKRIVKTTLEEAEKNLLLKAHELLVDGLVNVRQVMLDCDPANTHGITYADLSITHFSLDNAIKGLTKILADNDLVLLDDGKFYAPYQSTQAPKEPEFEEDKHE